MFLGISISLHQLKVYAAAVSNWILATGAWRDIGVWDDTDVWKDAP
jgi:hypothetical protein